MLRSHFAAGLIHKPALRKSTLLQTMKMPIESPPYRKIRALRLYETPATPRTLFKKATTETPAQNRFIRKPLATAFPPQTPDNRPKPFAVHNKTLEPVTANINPFSPSSTWAECARAPVIVTLICVVFFIVSVACFQVFWPIRSVREPTNSIARPEPAESRW